VTRNHRRWHALLWLLLGPLIVAGFVVGLLARPAPEYEPSRFTDPGRANQVDTKPQPREGVP
jgi:hypothetical protein